MSDPINRTAQLATDVEAQFRYRMMGIHVGQPVRGRRAGGVRPDRSALCRLLVELGLSGTDITHVHWYTARRPVARIDLRGAEPVVLKWLDTAEMATDNES